MAYIDLNAWKESFQLAKDIYNLTEYFPSTERYGLISQMRRAALSIPSNLAEGSRRNTKKDFKQFCAIAFGSASELEVQLRFAKEINFAPEDAFIVSSDRLTTTLKLLNGLNRSL